jgi:hypothetical protein
MIRRAPIFILPLAIISFLITGVSANTLLDPLPENSTTRFGQALVTLGDVNGDGIPDLAVAAPFQDGDFVSTERGYGKPQNVGKIFILDGSTLFLLNILNDPEFEQTQSQHFGGQLGSSLSPVADLNGDGIPDLLAGVPHHVADPDADEAKISAGEAFVFSGKDGTVLFTLTDPTAAEDDKMGTAVAALGDVDGDEIADLLVGVPGKDIGGEDGLSNVGLAYIFSGKTGQVILTLNHPDEGGAEAGAAFGTAVANAGDIDGDGVTDALIGAPGESQAFVFNGKTGSLIFTLVSPFTETFHSFGAAVAGGKDFNRDRKPDLVVGSPARENFQGAAYIFNGSDGSLQRTLLPATRQPFAQFGASLFVSDDLTGNRRPDVAVGAPGQNVNGLLQAGAITVFDGRRGRIFQTLSSAAPQANAAFGAGLTTADFDSDGVATVVAGTPNRDAEIDSVAHLAIGEVEIQP